MSAEPVIAIVDVGKTNKKFFLFSKSYELRYETSVSLEEIFDEDGYPCEDLERLVGFVKESLQQAMSSPCFDVQAVNFSAYGASFVLIDELGKPAAPLYNYLKPYPSELKEALYASYGGELAVSLETASPSLGSLNSGLQLYRLKVTRPDLYNRVTYALHLPQYLSYLFTGVPCSEMTSTGCHTQLWAFENGDYHPWVYDEKIHQKLAPFFTSRTVTTDSGGKKIQIGTGFHDSSAALIPYQVGAGNDFVLISTGTWSISLNPGDITPLTESDLNADCLFYLDFRGKKVKASRLFLGSMHDKGVKEIASRYHVHEEYFTGASGLSTQPVDQAYYELMVQLVEKQVRSTRLVMQSNVKKIIVDGGFSNNRLFMGLLAASFPKVSVYRAYMPQATALGSALAIHESWNDRPLPNLFSLTLQKAHSLV